MLLFCVLLMSLLSLPAHAFEQKEITVIILSYNNKQWYEQTLISALNQDYSNYKIIYIDDCSDDGMSELVQLFITVHDTKHRITYVRNATRKGTLANHWHAIHDYCSDDTIVVHLDGDGDMFAHPYVLQRVNQEYQDPQVWLTYGSFKEFPSDKIGWAYEIPRAIVNQNEWRSINDIRWGPTHLRTFYAWLFKEIKLEDLFYNGTFFPVTGDVAFMYPLAEMAAIHTRFIPDILYVYNISNPLNDFNTQLPLQLGLHQYLRMQKKRYQPLTKRPEKKECSSADLVVFSFDRPLQLYAFLESVEKYVTGIAQISVMYRTSSDAFYNAYEQVAHRFSWASFIHQSRENPQADFKDTLLHTVFDSGTPYVLFAVDDIVIKDRIHVGECITFLEKTHAYGFFLRLGKNINACYMLWDGPQPLPNLTEIAPNVFAWQFCYGKGDWWYPNSLDMTLYEKVAIQKDFYSYDYTSPNTLEAVLFTNPDMNKLGLCYGCSKIINIPLNRVQNDRQGRNMNCPNNLLLEIFQQGGKFDINPIAQLDNHAVHMEYIPTIIHR